MENLYYIGQDLLYFAVALLGTQIIMWIAGKLIKDKEKKINFKTSWYNLIFSILFLLLYPQVGVILTVFNLLVLLFGIRFTVLKDKKVSDWGTGIIFILITVLNIFNGEYDKEWEFAIVGIAWLLFRFVIQKEKFWKFSKMGFFTLLSMIIGFIVYSFGYNYEFNTAHIITDEYEVKMDGMSADVSGYATPNSKVKTYLNGKEVTPAEKADEDGYFSFEANKPGKWTVKITKNGETDTDYTVVKASKKYKEKKADLTKVRFMDSFAVMSDSLESLGVDEYNRWSEADDSGQGGSVNDLITQVQKEHKDDVLTATSKKVGLDESISELKNMNDKEYNQYSNYYNDMVTFYRTVLNPPAGYKDNFGDKFDDLRDRINNDFDEMSR
ncbi:hypothetical protein [Ligilactobacillus salivarius]|uniref:hypothetical protein n=1 Tax=Ligilactobacillus salivarius TaxID=1624 RepID=UPI0009DA989B|nr:hypothetical protein [Ligilactobacillus salivarius]ATP36084.1 hypothetical protein CR249_07575 [Ligilactobacillus salivarius]MDE1524750.1 hypothetical protein [Ligilactobacillus salivarius]MDF4187681.1 hypothetical protein [Ligilactobacillus salivarius]OQR02948.1 hypothetical protein B6U48_04470 [Ligilactobacillus salivarius]OQR04892.1 hypothetical protein B6U49_04635 [Ligilactobacillus salivarius]